MLLLPFFLLPPLLNAHDWNQGDIKRESLAYNEVSYPFHVAIGLKFLELDQIDSKHWVSSDVRYNKWKKTAKIASAEWFTRELVQETVWQAVFPQNDVDSLERDLLRASSYFFAPSVLYPLQETQQETLLEDEYLTQLRLLFENYKTTIAKTDPFYIQGMHCIAASILQSLDGDQDKALRIFGMILYDYEYYDTMGNNMKLLLDRFDIFETLMAEKFPLVVQHLDEISPGVRMSFFMDNFMTFFQFHTDLFPETKLRILDGFIQHGWRMLYAVSLGIFDMLQLEILKTSDAEQLMKLIKNFPQYIKPHRDILSIRTTLKYLKQISPQQVQVVSDNSLH